MPREKVMASIDIGSQAVQMLVARCYPDGHMEPINEYVAATHLAAGLHESGELSEDSMSNTIKAAKEMQEIATQEGSSTIFLTTCSAIREASNKSRFLLMCNQKLNIYPQLLSGKDEARLSYLGVTIGLPQGKPALVLGVGGSSIQIAYGVGGSIVFAGGVPFGAGAIERQHAFGNSTNILKQRQVSNQVKKDLQDICNGYFAWAGSLKEKPEALLSGSIASNLAGLILGHPVVDFKSVDHTPCSDEELFDQFKKLARLNTKERLAVPGIDPAMEKLLVSGLFLLHCLLECFQVEDFKISYGGLRTGVIRYLMSNSSNKAQ